MDDKWDLLDALRFREFERRQKQLRSFSNTATYWEELRAFQLECVEDVSNFTTSLAGKISPLKAFISAYRGYLSESAKPCPFSEGSIHPVGERLGEVCKKIIFAADDAVLQSMDSLCSGIETQIVELIYDADTYLCPNYSLLWRDAAEVLLCVSKADMRVKLIHDKLLEVLTACKSTGPVSGQEESFRSGEQGAMVDRTPSRLSSPFPDGSTAAFKFQGDTNENSNPTVGSREVELMRGCNITSAQEMQHNMWKMLSAYYSAVLRFDVCLARCNERLLELFRGAVELEGSRHKAIMHATESILKLQSHCGQISVFNTISIAELSMRSGGSFGPQTGSQNKDVGSGLKSNNGNSGNLQGDGRGARTGTSLTSILNQRVARRLQRSSASSAVLNGRSAPTSVTDGSSSSAENVEWNPPSMTKTMRDHCDLMMRVLLGIENKVPGDSGPGPASVGTDVNLSPTPQAHASSSTGLLIKRVAVMYRKVSASPAPNKFAVSTPAAVPSQPSSNGGLTAFLVGGSYDSSAQTEHKHVGDWVPVLMVLTTGGRLHIFDVPARPVPGYEVVGRRSSSTPTELSIETAARRIIYYHALDCDGLDAARDVERCLRTERETITSKTGSKSMPPTNLYQFRLIKRKPVAKNAVNVNSSPDGVADVMGRVYREGVFKPHLATHQKGLLETNKVAEAVASEEYFAPSYSVRLDRCEVKYNPQLTGSWSGRADSKTGVSPEAVASCLAFDLVEFIPADPGTSSGLYSYVFGSSGTSTSIRLRACSREQLFGWLVVLAPSAAKGHKHVLSPSPRNALPAKNQSSQDAAASVVAVPDRVAMVPDPSVTDPPAKPKAYTVPRLTPQIVASLSQRVAATCSPEHPETRISNLDTETSQNAVLDDDSAAAAPCVGYDGETSLNATPEHAAEVVISKVDAGLTVQEPSSTENSAAVPVAVENAESALSLEQADAPSSGEIVEQEEAKRDHASADNGADVSASDTDIAFGAASLFRGPALEDDDCIRIPVDEECSGMTEEAAAASRCPKHAGEQGDTPTELPGHMLHRGVADVPTSSEIPIEGELSTCEGAGGSLAGTPAEKSKVELTSAALPCAGTSPEKSKVEAIPLSEASVDNASKESRGEGIPSAGAGGLFSGWL